jgi:hypothetical protein
MAITSSWILSKILILMYAVCGLLADIGGGPALAPFVPPPLLADLAPLDDRRGESATRDELDADEREYALSRNCPLLVAWCPLTLLADPGGICRVG